MVRKVFRLMPVMLLMMAFLPVGVWAQTATATATPSRASEIKVEGIVQSLQNNVLVIGGQPIDVSSARIESGVAVGGFAEAYVTPSATGAWVAREVELHRDDDSNEVEIKGIATEVGTNFVVIGGRRFDLTNAIVRTNVVAGAFVELELRLSNTGQWVSVEIKLDDDHDRDDDRNDDRGRNRGNNANDDNSGRGSSDDNNRGSGSSGRSDDDDDDRSGSQNRGRGSDDDHDDDDDDDHGSRGRGGDDDHDDD